MTINPSPGPRREDAQPTRPDAGLSTVRALEDRQDDPTTGKKKPSPRRVAQEGFVAESACRHEQTDFKVNT
jgi:hypothetical protein